MGAKPKCNKMDKITDGFTRGYPGIRYLVFGGKKYDYIYGRIRNLVGVTSGVTYVISHN